MTNCQEEILCIQKILESAREFVNVFYPKLIEARDILQNLSIDIEGQTTTIRIYGKRLKCIDENIVSEATVNKLAQVAVFEYLFYCFDTNENLKQSIDSFCREKYVTKEHQKKYHKSAENVTASADPNEKKKLSNAIDKLSRINKNYKTLVGNDHIYIKTIAKEPEYSFTVLTQADWLKDGYLQGLFKDIFDNRVFMETSTAHERRSGDYGLASTFANLDQILEKIYDTRQGGKSGKKCLSDIEFVSSCFSLYELESICRFLLFAEMAKTLAPMNAHLNLTIPESIEMLAGEVSANMQPYISSHVFDYLENIHYGFLYDQDEIRREILKRNCLGHRFVIGTCVGHLKYTFGKSPSWTDDFIKETADFFTYECPVTKMFQPLNLQRIHEKCKEENTKYTPYDYIRMLYKSSLVDRNLIEEERALYRENRANKKNN